MGRNGVLRLRLVVVAVDRGRAEVVPGVGWSVDAVGEVDGGVL
ncbi:hypothetical protein ACFV8Z_45550 [Streptomyces sp. NPDC059837]